MSAYTASTSNHSPQGLTGITVFSAPVSLGIPYHQTEALLPVLTGTGIHTLPMVIRVDSEPPPFKASGTVDSGSPQVPD